MEGLSDFNCDGSSHNEKPRLIDVSINSFCCLAFQESDKEMVQRKQFK